ncbi:MAG: hypothetical protein ACTSVA_00680 [Candidatus Njordarchaeales archaeon]
MRLYAILVLHESGLPIYRKFVDWEERPIEPLVAAILGLAGEIGVGSISHVAFEDVYLMVLRGIKNKSLLLAMFVERADHLAYIKGLYLLAKIENKVTITEEIITDDVISAVKDVIESFLDRLELIPDFLQETIGRVIEKFTPPHITSLELVLFRRFGEDPLLVLLKSPRKFLDVLVELLGEDAAVQFILSILREISKNYNVSLDTNGIARKAIMETRFEDPENVRLKLRSLVERIVDQILERHQ